MASFRTAASIGKVLTVAAISAQSFVKDYSEALRNGDAALFVGAGISRAAGFVDWKALLKDIATDLGLDVEKEADLVALAQYHKNHRKGRVKLNQLIMNEFLEDAEMTDSLKLIGTLPVHCVWTTNYDELLEQAFGIPERRIDVKRKNEDFTVSRRRTDVTIFKMHGDVTSPESAVITKDDYEAYNQTRELFTIALKGDLARKTFLFLGFSFADPNVGYILGRVKQLLEQNARDHFCILKRPDSKADGDYTCTRFDHWLDDLHRYHIQPVLIADYAEIPKLLADLNRHSHLQDVFVSGSAHDFSPLGKDKFHELCRLLGEELIRSKFNVVSGFGVGVGDMVIAGAMQRLRRNDDERLQLWPFPQEVPTGTDRAKFWTEYRTRMISDSGACVVLAGNKHDQTSGATVVANGVEEEVRIAFSQGKILIPVGSTGHVAQSVWQDVSANQSKYFGSLDVSKNLAILGDTNSTASQLVAAVIDTLKQVLAKGI